MEQQEQSLFGLSIDPNTRSHLMEAARWARFLAIVGMVFMGLFLIYGIVIATSPAFFMRRYDTFESRAYATGYQIGTMIYFLVIAILYFFPLLFTLQFANRMKVALNGNSQHDLNESFRNLKKALRFLGILTIIFLAFMALGILLVVVAGTVSGL